MFLIVIKLLFNDFVIHIGNNLWSILQTLLSGYAIYLAYNILNKQEKFQNKHLEISLLYQQSHKIAQDSLFLYNEQKGYREGSDEYKTCTEQIANLSKHYKVINIRIEQIGKELGLGMYGKK